MNAAPGNRWKRFDFSRFDFEGAPDDKRAVAADLNARAKKLMAEGAMEPRGFLSLADLKRAVKEAEARKEANGTQTN